MSDPVIATLAASPPRRFMGTAMLALLGGLLLYLAFELQMGASQVLLLGMGIGALLASARLHRATAQVIELTPEHLRIQGGAVLAEINDIEKVERGAFAFKPSNGFSFFLLTQLFPIRSSIDLHHYIVYNLKVQRKKGCL